MATSYLYVFFTYVRIYNSCNTGMSSAYDKGQNLSDFPIVNSLTDAPPFNLFNLNAKFIISTASVVCLTIVQLCIYPKPKSLRLKVCIATHMSSA